MYASNASLHCHVKYYFQLLNTALKFTRQSNSISAPDIINISKTKTGDENKHCTMQPLTLHLGGHRAPDFWMGALPPQNRLWQNVSSVIRSLFSMHWSVFHWRNVESRSIFLRIVMKFVKRIFLSASGPPPTLDGLQIHSATDYINRSSIKNSWNVNYVEDVIKTRFCRENGLHSAHNCCIIIIFTCSLTCAPAVQ